MRLFGRKDKREPEARCLWFSGPRPCRNRPDDDNHKGLCSAHYKIWLSKLH